jgi:2-keto-4-pentenoate hydratase/2-oxohepta-3-ene-1,7-dioic acid hydratase in catechol pathway|tara:strand:- start:2979 stop:3824 length:846 start_codon:yes stop_codon:yes gene_type:complete
MKLVSFTRAGTASYGLVVEGGVVDAGAVLGDKYTNLRQILEADALAELQDLATRKADFSLEEIEFIPVIPEPQKTFCIGINYMTHIKEMNREKPEFPWVFIRHPHCQVGQGQEMIRPKASECFDFEGELAVIIGKTGHNIKREDSLSHIAGYSCYNDGSIRDFQRHSQLFTAGKNFYKSGSFGPWMVTSDEIPDPTQLSLETRLNGEVMQSAKLSDLCFDIPYLIEYLSTIGPLCPGDVIVTGTPGGVGFGRDPYVWMKEGDTIEVEISSIGVLSNPIKDE